MSNAQPIFFDRHAVVWLALASVLVFNLVDAGLTLWAVHMGYAVEANPFMAHVLSLGSLPFVITKLSLVSGGVALLWQLRTRFLATVGSLAALGAYLFVMSCHIETFRHLLAS